MLGTDPNIFTRLVTTCWALFRGVLLLAVVLVIALGTFVYFRWDDEAHRISAATLNRYCAPFEARVGSTQFAPGRGVTLHNVQIVEPVAWGPARGVLHIEELQVEGAFDLQSLLRGKPIVKRIVAKTPRLAATRQKDGTWNLAGFKPPPAGGQPMPTIELRNATVLLTGESGDPKRSLGLHHVDATIKPSTDDPNRIAITATARNTIARSFEVRGEAAKNGSSFDLNYRVEGVELSRELFGSLYRYGLMKMPPQPVRGLLSVAGKASLSAGQPMRGTANFELASGEYRWPGIDRPLTEIALAGEATPAGLKIDRGSARWGDASLRFAGQRTGWSLLTPTPMAWRCRVENFDVGSTPRRLLPARAAQMFDRFRPAGRTDIECDLAYDGRRWAPRATIAVREASFEDGEKFPYRLTNASGQILVNGGVSDQPITHDPLLGSDFDVQLVGNADGAPVRVTAAFKGVGKPNAGPPSIMPLGWADISGNGIPISDRLINAVREEGARDFIHELHPSGRIDASWRAERSDPADPQPRVALRMRLDNCRMHYDRFPYPLSGVTGWIHQRNKQWHFTELQSRDPQGRTIVAGQGSLEPREGTCRFDLRLAGTATPLDQTLFDALPSSAQQAWALMRPRGKIDFVADISRECGQPSPSVRLAMNPHNRDLLIEPPLSESGYRYRLERLDGEFAWAADRLTMRNARAEHGRTQYSANGAWEAMPTGGWKLDLQGLNADRLEFNREFLLAAPAGLRTAIEDLQPRGGFDLFDSRLEVTRAAGIAGPVEARWRMGINCHQASINPGVPLDGVSGVIRISGANNGATSTIAGELDLDSLFWNDLQLTNVRGPIWADGTDCFLGEGAARKLQATASRPVEAEAYGGQVRLTSWVRHGGQARYSLALGIAGVDVTRLSSEWLGRPEAIDGSLDGNLELHGSGATVYGMTGKGELAVSDAELYELPLFLGLLKTLRNRTPDNTAFNRLETTFTLEGEDILFENFHLLGDAVSLYGNGRANLRREVDLKFGTVVGRNEFTVPVLKAFVSSASQQFLRLHVEGPIDAPRVHREMLPAVGNVLEQLQSEFGGPATDQAARPRAPTRR